MYKVIALLEHENSPFAPSQHDFTTGTYRFPQHHHYHSSQFLRVLASSRPVITTRLSLCLLEDVSHIDPSFLVRGIGILKVATCPAIGLPILVLRVRILDTLLTIQDIPDLEIPEQLKQCRAFGIIGNRVPGHDDNKSIKGAGDSDVQPILSQRVSSEGVLAWYGAWATVEIRKNEPKRQV